MTDGEGAEGHSSDGFRHGYAGGDVSGSSIGIAMLIILIITAVELSLASSGTVAGATVMLETLKLPTDMVGLFSAFEIFTRNAGAAYDVTYSMLEELDAARETGNIHEENTL